MTLTSNRVTISITNGIHIVKFNNPQKRNAIHEHAYEIIVNSLNDAAKNPEVFCTVFTGEGDYYSSGFDIASKSGLSAEDPQKALETALMKVKTFIVALIDYPKLLIAVVNGPAIGIGCTMLGLCDIVYASDRATFQTPFANLGLCAEGCSSYTFPNILGKSKANELLLICHKMSAEEAEKYGFVSKVYKHAELRTVWDKIADLKNVSIESIITSKKMIKKFDVAKLHEANNMEIENLNKCFMSETFFNSMVKFMSKKNKSKL